MKIPASIRNAFDDQKEKNDRLKEKIDAIAHAIRKPGWHYESRVKALQSYALKVESGRVKKPTAVEDFFACVFVVANLAEVGEAEQLIRQRFTVQERRPPEPTRTHKRPEWFPFDDLRLYVALTPDPNLPPTGLEGLRFEFQVRTFLQHAWSIATHDLVYKTDDVSWSKERIAFQTKAMLEHAEISIQEAEKLAASGALAKEDRHTRDLKRAIDILRHQWEPDQLPADIRRLASNILQLVNSIDVSLDRLTQVLDNGKAATGSHPANLSPYGTVVQYLLTAEPAKLVAHLERAEIKAPVVVSSEIAVPAAIDRTKWANVVSV